MELSLTSSVLSDRSPTFCVSRSLPLLSSSAATRLPLVRGWRELLRTCTLAVVTMPFSISTEMVVGA